MKECTSPDGHSINRVNKLGEIHSNGDFQTIHVHDVCYRCGQSEEVHTFERDLR